MAMVDRLEGEAGEEFLERLDRRLFRLFMVLIILAIIIAFIVGLASQDVFATLVVLASLLTGSFFLIGLVAWNRMGDHGIIARKRMFQFTIITSSILSVLFALSSYFQGGGMVYFGPPGAGGDMPGIWSHMALWAGNPSVHARGAEGRPSRHLHS